MMPRSTKQEMLAQQLGFLKSSLQAYKDGDEAEALRIATTIRVLIHESKSSNPLLKQLDPNYLDLTILDRPERVPSKPGGKILMLFGVGVSVSTKSGAQPITDLSDPMLQPVPLIQWWTRPVLVFTDQNRQQVSFNRKDLLLILANKEGGAHVETKVPAAYEKYVVDSAVPFMVNGVMTDSVHLAQFASVESSVRMIECLERNFPWLKK
jgi:hypothetical protein